jgi:glyoxylase-like metal-dependent hydrolase (beta-lactamase superfamily II)/rhodanese-related sulfurtransferase
MPENLEIEAAVFAREVRDGTRLVVLDTRDPHAFADWHVEPTRGLTANISESEITANPLQVRKLLSGDTALRVICQAGNSSRRVTALLAVQGIDARSVAGGMVAWSRVLQRDEVPLEGPFGVVQFRREARGCLSYLVAAGEEAIVVDPAPEIGAYLEEAAARALRIVRVFDTHIHADHLSGARELATRCGAVLSLSQAALSRGVRYRERVTPIIDGETFELGGEAITVLGLPGHTSDMTGLLLGERALVGGDALFVDSVARPDLEDGDAGARDAARQLYRTLHKRIGRLPDSVLLLPCHYAGGPLEQALAVPLGAIRQRVPELSLAERDFVDRILSNMPPKPANFVAIIGFNLGEELAADDAARLEVGANNCAVSADWAKSNA